MPDEPYLPPVNRGFSVQASPEIESRDQFAMLCNKHGLLGRAVEVGTDKAAWALKYLKEWKGNKLVCVDPWRPLEDCPEIERDREPDMLIAAAALATQNWRVEIRRATSEEVAGSWRIPLSFCYLDANHDYDHVSQDIALWWPHIAPGGLLAGHDVGGEYPGVLIAVREMASRYGLRVYLTEDTPGSWYVYKPPAPTLKVNHRALRQRLELAQAALRGDCLLTLIIPRIASRREQWTRLKASLDAQRAELGCPASVVEILEDDCEEPLARKRQHMLDRAAGLYVAFVDDDDQVADAYISRLVSAIIEHPGIDVVSFEGSRTEDGKGLQRMHWSMAIRQNHRTPKTRYIMANHLCAMRTDVCRQVRFWRETEYASDQVYWRGLHLAGLLTTEIHLPDQLYHYDFRWNVTGTQSKDRYASAKAYNPHVLARVRSGYRAGEIVYLLGKSDGDVRSVIYVDGGEGKESANNLEELGQFDVW